MAPAVGNNFVNNWAASELNTPCHVGSEMPLDSAIPQLNVKKINSKIQDSQKKELTALKAKTIMPAQSPLTAFNIREKQFKKNLSGTYGKNYKDKEELSQNERTLTHEQHLDKLERAKEMRELLADLNLSNPSAIPDSYLHQPESDNRRWMHKRGKGNLIYYDKEQIE